MSEYSASNVDLSALAAFAPELAAAFASVSSDVALVLDSAGVVQSVAFSPNHANPVPQEWIGRRWVDTATTETRRKVDLLLEEAAQVGHSQRREINHPGANGSTIPMAYAAIRLGRQGPVVVAGRDLRAVAAIQQRFLETQKEMERTYWISRQAEARYRMLFQVATDAVWIVDASNMLVTEANPAALELLPPGGADIHGIHAATLFDENSRAAVRELLATARATGKPSEIRARVAGRPAALEVAATPFRADSVQMLLVRARQPASRPAGFESTTYLADFVEKTPDAVVVADSSGRITMANPSFFRLCGLDSESQAHGHLLSEVVGDPRQPFNLLLDQVSRTGIAGQARMTVQNRAGHSLTLDVSATLLAEGDQACAGFIIRPLATLVGGQVPAASERLRGAIDQLVRQIGQLPLQDLMVQATQLAERHLVEAALAECNGSAETASHVLGITRDSMAGHMTRLGLTAPPEPGHSPLH